MEKLFARAAAFTSKWTGKPSVFIANVIVILIWAGSGPSMGYSDTWQLIVNTGTTVLTYLMVFVIQNSQNRDGAAIQAKLDELIRVGKASNRFIGLEHLTDAEIEEIRGSYRETASKDLA